MASRKNDAKKKRRRRQSSEGADDMDDDLDNLFFDDDDDQSGAAARAAARQQGGSSYDHNRLGLHIGEFVDSSRSGPSRSPAGAKRQRLIVPDDDDNFEQMNGAAYDEDAALRKALEESRLEEERRNKKGGINKVSSLSSSSAQKDDSHGNEISPGRRDHLLGNNGQIDEEQGSSALFSPPDNEEEDEELKQALKLSEEQTKRDEENRKKLNEEYIQNVNQIQQESHDLGEEEKLEKEVREKAKFFDTKSDSWVEMLEEAASGLREALAKSAGLVEGATTCSTSKSGKEQVTVAHDENLKQTKNNFSFFEILDGKLADLCFSGTIFAREDLFRLYDFLKLRNKGAKWYGICAAKYCQEAFQRIVEAAEVEQTGNGSAVVSATGGAGISSSSAASTSAASSSTGQLITPAGPNSKAPLLKGQKQTTAKGDPKVVLQQEFEQFQSGMFEMPDLDELCVVPKILQPFLPDMLGTAAGKTSSSSGSVFPTSTSSGAKSSSLLYSALQEDDDCQFMGSCTNKKRPEGNKEGTAKGGPTGLLFSSTSGAGSSSSASSTGGAAAAQAGGGTSSTSIGGTNNLLGQSSTEMIELSD